MKTEGVQEMQSKLERMGGRYTEAVLECWEPRTFSELSFTAPLVPVVKRDTTRAFE